MDRCVNCNIATNRCNTTGRIGLDDESTLAVVRQWCDPNLVSSDDHVCRACWDLAQLVIVERHSVEEARQLSQRHVCLRCGRSLKSHRATHTLHNNSAREARIYNVIKEWILPQTIQEGNCICHPCWMAADRTSGHMESGPSTSSEESQPIFMQPPHPELPVNIDRDLRSSYSEATIVLPHYVRASETQCKCFIVGCQSTERHRVPISVRKMLLVKYKYYVPENNRLCDQHLVTDTWDLISVLGNNYNNNFTATHIEDMLFLNGVRTTGQEPTQRAVSYK